MLIPCIITYLIGAFPTGLMISKLKGIDIKKVGSGNVGATNIYRNLGILPGILTLLVDCSKAIIALGIILGFDTLFSAAILKETFTFNSYTVSKAAILGLCAILGHIISIPMIMKGGKGVATGLGVLLAFSPLGALAALAIFIFVFKASRYVSLASIIAVFSSPLLMLYQSRYSPESQILVWLFLLIAIIITYKHKQNIKRLLGGVENRL